MPWGYVAAATIGAKLLGGGGGGGGGGGQPTSQTVTQTTIPDYAKPYVEQMLGAGQEQIFNYKIDPTTGQKVPDTLKGYTPFGIGAPGAQQAGAYNPLTGQYDFSQAPAGAAYQTGMGPQEMQAAQSAVAGYSPLQQRAFQSAAGLQMPGTYQQAADVTGAGIMGALGTTQQAQALQGLGMQAANVGNQYNRMATNPFATQAFMNPYLQASLAPQIAEAQRQSDILGTQQAGQAVKSGAFGGSRAGLLEAERQRNLGQNISNIVGQGYNQAFNQAQQAQQFGANLGLQGMQAGMQGVGAGIGAAQAGYGQAMQGAGQLAGIGGQQLQAQQGILGLQSQMGAQQQAQQQNIINQAIQNYANTQQYPQQQLGFMNSLLRGLPMSATNQTQYQAPPSMVSQLAGLGMGAYGLSQLGKKKGGAIKEDTSKPAGLMGLALNKIGA